MEASYPNALRVWDGRTIRKHLMEIECPSPAWDMRMEPLDEAELALQMFASEALEPSLRSARRTQGAIEPYSSEWFAHIEHRRHQRNGKWIPRLLEFTKHQGETLLGLGYGLGADWVQYARNGANVIVSSPSHSQLDTVRRHFDLRKVSGRFLHALPDHLPLESASIDVVCVNRLLQEMPQPHNVLTEVYRVLKPGGKVIALTMAKYDVDFWVRACFFWYRWLLPNRRQGEAQYVRYSARLLRKLFGNFVEHRVHKRHIRRRDVPHLWRLMPLSMLGRMMGRMLIVKAFKPVSAGMSASAEAA